MTRKKIVFVITKAEVGGAQTWVYELKKNLSSVYDIYLIVSDNGWLTSKFDPEKIKIIPEIKKLTSIKASYQIANFLKKISADIVISSSASAGIHARLAKIYFKHKHIYVSHGWSCIYNGGYFKKIFCSIELFLSLITDEILCVSQKDKDNAIDIIGIKENKISLIKNCITPHKEKVVTNIRKKIIFVGRLTSPKRPDLLIQACEHFPDIDFYIVGDGPQKFSLEQQSINLNNVFFLGEIENFASFYNYDIFILCSDSEGLPMSALEAASAGLPLLLSNVGGCSELIIPDNGNKNGILFNNTATDLNIAIYNILNNYEAFYHQAKKIKPIFDISNSKNKYIKIIEG